MRTMLLLIIPLFGIGLLIVIGHALASLPHLGRLQRERTELTRRHAELRELVARLKDIAWDERQIDPHLSTIIIDEIRAYEKRELEN